MMKFKKVYIEITNICNKNCIFCPSSNRKKEEMTPDNFNNVLKEVKNYANYIYLHVKGEPLIHSEFQEIINICDLYDIHVNITTNGSLLYRQKEIIAKSKSIRQINISIHSINNEKEIDEVLNAVNYIREKKDIYIVYRYWLLQKETVLEKNTVLDKVIKFYNLSNEQKENIYKQGNIKIDKHTYINKDFEFEWPSLENENYGDRGYCYGLKTHFSILSDGTVTPCCLDSEGIICLGNIYRESLDDILNSSRTQQIITNFKNNIKIEELCKHCAFKK